MAPTSPASLALRCSAISSSTLARRLGSSRDEVGDERVLGRKLQRGRAVDGVDARGEDGDLVACRAGCAVELEIDQRAFAAADPVALLRDDLLGPAGQCVEVLEQFVGVIGDAQEPLLQLALLDQRGLRDASSSRWPAPARWPARWRTRDTSSPCCSCDRRGPFSKSLRKNHWFQR